MRALSCLYWKLPLVCVMSESMHARMHPGGREIGCILETMLASWQSLTTVLAVALRLALRLACAGYDGEECCTHLSILLQGLGAMAKQVWPQACTNLLHSVQCFQRPLLFRPIPAERQLSEAALLAALSLQFLRYIDYGYFRGDIACCPTFAHALIFAM